MIGAYWPPIMLEWKCEYIPFLFFRINETSKAFLSDKVPMKLNLFPFSYKVSTQENKASLSDKVSIHARYTSHPDKVSILF